MESRMKYIELMMFYFSKSPESIEIRNGRQKKKQWPFQFIVNCWFHYDVTYLHSVFYCKELIIKQHWKWKEYFIMFKKIFKLCNHHLDILTWIHVNMPMGNSYDSNDKESYFYKFLFWSVWGHRKTRKL